MSQKRKWNDQPDGESGVHTPAAKKPFRPGKGPHKFKAKRPQQDDDGSGRSISELKSRIRNLRRLLDHVESVEKHKMPAGMRIERERELEACEHELAEKSAASKEAERRRNLISKYHHVRFFDRQKATRILKKLRRKLATDGESPEGKDKLAELQKDIHDAEVAVNYSIYYPLMKPYCSLYPRNKQEKGGEDVEMKEGDAHKEPKAKGNLEMWAAVEKAMAEGTLDELRNRNEGAASRRAKMEEEASKKKEKKKERRKTDPTDTSRPPRRPAAQPAQQDGDESDGGFFE